MSFKNLFLGISTALLLCSCGNLAQKENIAVSRGVYATQDAINKGRFDLAKKYNDETTRLVPPPPKKERINVREFRSDKVKIDKNKITSESETPASPYIVLPEGFDKNNVVVVGSVEYNNLLDQNKQLKGQVQSEKQTFQQYKERNDEIIRLKEEELQKLRNKPGFFRTIWNLATGFLKWGSLGFIIIAIVMIAAAFLIPGLAPFIWAIFRTIGSIFGVILGILRRIMYWLIGRLKKK